VDGPGFLSRVAQHGALFPDLCVVVPQEESASACLSVFVLASVEPATFVAPLLFDLEIVCRKTWVAIAVPDILCEESFEMGWMVAVIAI